MEIPVKNIYYLLCYAWNKLDEGDIRTVADSDYNDLLELFTKVLLNGCTHLFKIGLEHKYLEKKESYAGIKGKLNFGESLKTNSFERGFAVCEFDEFVVDTLHNQLLKATIRRLYKTEGMDVELLHNLRSTYYRFAGVTDIELNRRCFSQIKMHRNNAYYDFLLKLCLLIFENTVLNEESGNYKFKDFLRDDKKMAALFEEFIRNFYKKHLDGTYHVSAPKISWAAESFGKSNMALLPQMWTDVVLESKERKIIIDAKYYREALKSNFDKATFNSPNLYQLYSYLRNIEEDFSNHLNAICEGILLYPVVEYYLSETFLIGGHKFSIKTVDLAKEWKEVHEELMMVIQ